LRSRVASRFWSWQWKARGACLARCRRARPGTRRRLAAPAPPGPRRAPAPPRPSTSSSDGGTDSERCRHMISPTTPSTAVPIPQPLSIHAQTNTPTQISSPSTGSLPLCKQPLLAAVLSCLHRQLLMAPALPSDAFRIKTTPDQGSTPGKTRDNNNERQWPHANACVVGQMNTRQYCNA
jgi:hypothetical protein